MKKTTLLFCTLAAGSALFSCSAPQQETAATDYTQYVNTFIGAADNGHTFPGACRPFGMIQTSPVTGAVGWRYCSEYVYEDSVIWGFTQTPETVIGHGTAIAALSRRIAKVRLLVIIPLRSTNRA